MSKVFHRKLGYGLARRCEAAVGPICLCRCSGTFHGKSHQVYQQAEVVLFEEKRAKKEEITDIEIQDLVKRIEATLTLATGLAADIAKHGFKDATGTVET